MLYSGTCTSTNPTSNVQGYGSQSVTTNNNHYHDINYHKMNNCNSQVSSNSDSCTTKMGKAVEFILGITIEVAQFDKARQRHKQWPKNNFYFEEYMDKLADMETKVSKQQHQFRDQLAAQWEQEFFVKNNCKVATQNDIASSPPAKLLVDKLKYAKAILNKFKA